MKQRQTIFLLVIPIVVAVATTITFALVLTATTLNNTLAQTGNNNTEIKEYQFITQWGSLGTEPGQFDGPSGLAVDNEDNIYVTENDNDRI